MKYKLINTTTSEEHLCNKVTIDGFDYYVSDEETKWAIDENNKLVNLWFYPEKLKGFVLATNNPNIDIPKVVNEVDGLAEEITTYEHFCDSSLDYASHYKGVKIGYNKSQETHPFSEEDMIDFYEWCDTSEEAVIFWRKNRVDPDMSGNHWKKIRENRKKLLQLWKEQRTKIIYYE